MKFYYLVFQTADGPRVGTMTAAGLRWVTNRECAEGEGWITLDYEEAKDAWGRTLSPSKWFIVEEELEEHNVSLPRV